MRKKNPKIAKKSQHNMWRAILHNSCRKNGFKLKHHYTNIDWCRGQHWKIVPRSSAMLPEGQRPEDNIEQLPGIIFTAQSSNASIVFWIIILSLRLSVTCVLCDETKKTYWWYFDTTWKSNHSSFLIPTEVGGQYPLPLKFALKVTHPFWIMPTSTNICL